jgi:2-keto-4-pentenoate hydratase/2-oxohepta-3-ene-1,7-dioic acid hydratase in catechol pathway
MLSVLKSALGGLALVAFALLSLPAQAQVTEGDDAPLRFGRFEHQGNVVHGFLSAGGIHELSGSFFDATTVRTGWVIPLEEVRILAPVLPGKVIGIALNYKSHGGEQTDEPQFFAKLPSSVIAHEATIVPPKGSKNLHYEGEVVIVMGARASKVPEAQALEYVFGVTAGNDVTERSFGSGGFDVLRAKGSDTFAPLGPWIVPGLSVDNLKLETQVNGKTVQQGSTKQMIHSAAKIIATVSKYITLEPGDVIYTGTPGVTQPLNEGDVVDVMVEGVGRLRNTVGATAAD